MINDPAENSNEFYVPDLTGIIEPPSGPVDYIKPDGTRAFDVILKQEQDLEAFYEDMETPGGNLYIPDRKVDVYDRLGNSRAVRYMLTEEEASTLKQDPRVESVVPYINRPVSHNWFETGNFHKGSTLTLPSQKNWGLLRCLEATSRPNWGSESGKNTATGSIEITQEAENVDVVIVDGHIDPAHPEFAVNQNGTGGSRITQLNWLDYSASVGYPGNGRTVYQYAPYVYPSDEVYNRRANHGAHVAGTVAGNSQGWARKAKIYNISPYSENDANVSYSYKWLFIKEFHRRKKDNIATKDRPTVVNGSYGVSMVVVITSIPAADTATANSLNRAWIVAPNEIESVTYRGTTYANTSNNPFTIGQLLDWGIIFFYFATFDGVRRLHIVLNYNPGDLTTEAAQIRDCISEGIIVVFSAGNNSTHVVEPTSQDYNNVVKVSLEYYRVTGYMENIYWNRLADPASAPGSIVVGSVGTTSVPVPDRISTFSNKGSAVTIYAPGSDIISAYNSVQYPPIPAAKIADYRNSNYPMVSISGTSMSAPQVTGVAALLLAANPSWNQVDVRNHLINNSKNTLNTTTGGKLDYTDYLDSYNRYLFSTIGSSVPPVEITTTTTTQVATTTTTTQVATTTTTTQSGSATTTTTTQSGSATTTTTTQLATTTTTQLATTTTTTQLVTTTTTTTSSSDQIGKTKNFIVRLRDSSRYGPILANSQVVTITGLNFNDRNLSEYFNDDSLFGPIATVKNTGYYSKQIIFPDEPIPGEIPCIVLDINPVVTGAVDGAVYGGGAGGTLVGGFIITPYGLDSDLNTAAVHSGLINVGETVSLQLGLVKYYRGTRTSNAFVGSTANGITSYDRFEGCGFYILGLGEPVTTTTAAPTTTTTTPAPTTTTTTPAPTTSTTTPAPTTTTTATPWVMSWSPASIPLGAGSTLSWATTAGGNAVRIRFRQNNRLIETKAWFGTNSSQLFKPFDATKYTSGQVETVIELHVDTSGATMVQSQTLYLNLLATVFNPTLQVIPNNNININSTAQLLITNAPPDENIVLSRTYRGTATATQIAPYIGSLTVSADQAGTWAGQNITYAYSGLYEYTFNFDPDYLYGISGSIRTANIEVVDCGGDIVYDEDNGATISGSLNRWSKANIATISVSGLGPVISNQSPELTFSGNAIGMHGPDNGVYDLNFSNLPRHNEILYEFRLHRLGLLENSGTTADSASKLVIDNNTLLEFTGSGLLPAKKPYELRNLKQNLNYSRNLMFQSDYVPAIYSSTPALDAEVVSVGDAAILRLNILDPNFITNKDNMSRIRIGKGLFDRDISSGIKSGLNFVIIRNYVNFEFKTYDVYNTPGLMASVINDLNQAPADSVLVMIGHNQFIVTLALRNVLKNDWGGYSDRVNYDPNSALNNTDSISFIFVGQKGAGRRIPSYDIAASGIADTTLAVNNYFDILRHRFKLGHHLFADGYIDIKTQWYPHTGGLLNISHVLGHTATEKYKEQYISHVKLSVRQNTICSQLTTGTNPPTELILNSIVPVLPVLPTTTAAPTTTLTPIPAAPALNSVPLYITAGTYNNYNRSHYGPIIVTGAITVTGKFEIRSYEYIDFSDAVITCTDGANITMISKGFSEDYPGYNTTYYNNFGACGIVTGKIVATNSTVRMFTFPNLDGSGQFGMHKDTVFNAVPASGAPVDISCKNFYTASIGMSTSLVPQYESPLVAVTGQWAAAAILGTVTNAAVSSGAQRIVGIASGESTYIFYIPAASWIPANQVVFSRVDAALYENSIIFTYTTLTWNGSAWVVV